MVVLTIESKKSYDQLIEEMESLEGYKIIEGIKQLKDTNYVFTQNYLELITNINLYEKDPEIWFAKNRPKIDIILSETLRLLHNYLSSVLTLIDHTRNFRKRISDGRINIMFERELGRLSINDVVIFMKHFRQYLQHYSLPIVSASFSAETVSFVESQYTSDIDELLKKLNGEITHKGTENQYIIERKLELDVNELLKWKGWNSRSKDYLEKFGDKVEIKVFCMEYFELIENIYSSLYKIVIDVYKNEIMELEIFKKYIIELYPSREQFLRNLP